MSRGYLFTPGLYEDAHVEGWRRVTDAVHGGGGTLFVQLMHAGRISDPLLLDGEPPVAPSAVAPPLAEPYESPWHNHQKPYVVPRELSQQAHLLTLGDLVASPLRAPDAALRRES